MHRLAGISWRRVDGANCLRHAGLRAFAVAAALAVLGLGGTGQAQESTTSSGVLATGQLTATRSLPFSDSVTVDGGEIAVNAPAKGKKLHLAPEGTFIGNLFKGSDVGRVYVAGPAKKTPGVWAPAGHDQGHQPRGRIRRHPVTDGVGQREPSSGRQPRGGRSSVPAVLGSTYGLGRADEARHGVARERGRVDALPICADRD